MIRMIYGEIVLVGMTSALAGRPPKPTERLRAVAELRVVLPCLRVLNRLT